MDGGTQLSLFGDAQPESLPVQEETVTILEYKRKKKRTHDDWMSELPIEEVEHKEEHLVCEKCSSKMKKISKEKAYDELIYTPAEFHICADILCTLTSARTAMKIRRMTQIMRTISSPAISACGVSKAHDFGQFLFCGTAGTYCI